MATSYKSVNKYRKKNYDRLEVILPAGSKDQLKQLAAAAGVTVSRYIVEAIEARTGLSLQLGDVPPELAAARAAEQAAADDQGKTP